MSKRCLCGGLNLRGGWRWLWVLAAGLLAGLAPLRGQETPAATILEGALLIDGSGRPPLANSVLIVEDGRIRAIGKLGAMRYPEGAEIVNLRGKTIIPALINLHGHLGQTRDGFNAAADGYTADNLRDQLAKYLAYGVGTVVSLGTDQDLIYPLRDAQRAGELAGARLYTAGRGFGVKDGFPPGGAPKVKGAADRYRPQTPEQARAEVRELAAHKPDFVKMWVDDDFGRLPKMKPEIFRAIIEEAHQQGLRVIAHVFHLDDAKALVQAGVDGLGHSVRDQAVDADLISAMKARGVFLIPTLVRDESTFAYGDPPRWLDDPFFQAGLELGVLTALKSPAFINQNRANPDRPRLRAALAMGKKNLKTLFDAGVRIGFGTDSGPPTRFQGFFEHRELQLMVESGLTPLQAIAAATRTSAEILGAASEFGTLAPGRQADFLVLDASPLEDIHNTEELSAVWQAGKPLPPVTAR
jgi:imidazolonepropionase-like amidohydrolase